MGTELETAFLRRCIELAVEAGADGNRLFGAVLVSADGDVLAEGRNEASGGDVTAHAELVAIRRAAGRLPGSVMYASGEPCPMCAAACVWAGVARIVFAASTAGFTPILPPGPQFRLGCAELVASSSSGIEVIGPVLEEEALAAMRSSVAAG